MKKVLANILPRLTQRFSLRSTGDVTDLVLREEIQPITDVDQLLISRSILNTTTSVTANGLLTIYTVPVGKRVTIRGYQIELSTGTYTFDAVMVWDEVINLDCKLESFTATGTRVSTIGGAVITLEQGWKIQVAIVGYSVTGNLSFRAVIETQDAF